ASEAKQSPSNTGIASAQSMRLAMTSGDVLWLEGRSLSYDTAIPYAPFKDLFTRFFDLRAEEFDDEKYAKIYARVQETMGARADEIAPFIGAMLGLELKGDAAERTRYLEPPQLRGAVFGALAQFIGTLAQKPIVVMFEDLHWADSTSLDLIDQLLKLTESAPLMILALFRPQRQEPSWRFHENAQRDYAHRYTAIQLEPLDEKHSRQLVANLLEIEDLPEKVRALILKKAEGNPFFVEEVIRSLLDAKLVVRSNGHWRATREIENVAVPDTLQGVITARLDRLDEQSKKIAQTAAVIGREFAFQVLEQIAEARQGLNDSVVNLQRRELVREKSRVPELLYLFKHALTQETAYASVLLSKRRELHKKVADCLERVAPDRVNDIARHYLEAQDETRALPYLVEAGEKAAHAYSNPEAIQYLSRALEILQKADDKALARRAYEALGGTLMLTMQVEPALKHYHAMIEYGKAHNEMGMQVAAHNKLGRIFGMFMGQLEEGEKHLAEAERLGRDCNDGAGLSELYTIRCGVSTMQADFSNATHYLSESVNFGRQTNLSEPVAFGLTHTANTFTYMCRFDDAYEKGKEALQVSESIGNQLHISEIYAFVNPYYYAHLGDLERARIDAEKGSEIALRIGDGLDAAVGLYFLGMIARWRGEYENAIEFFNRTLQAAQMSSFPVHALPVAALGATLLEVSENLAAKANPLLQQGMEMLNNPFMAASGSSAWADLGFSFLALGKLDEAFANFQKGANYPGFMILLNKPRNLGGSALVALARKNFEDANKLIAEARAFAEEHAMKFEYPFLTIVDGMIRAARGDQSGALEKFTHAENLAQEMGMRVALLQARIATARVLAQMGKKTQADAKRKDARAMVDEIARLFKDEEMKRAFVESAGKRLTDDNRR
ncbi:MAG: AAA family ATPase, partial [Chloroflexi bacterium]|nr:AAA family ATPase [Chloroflexota bacterium]